MVLAWSLPRSVELALCANEGNYGVLRANGNRRSICRRGESKTWSTPGRAKPKRAKWGDFVRADRGGQLVLVEGDT